MQHPQAMAQFQEVARDKEDILSIQEADLLNSLIKQSQDTFDFHKKKVAFIIGSNGGRILTKAEYFQTCINPWIEEGEIPQVLIIELTAEEKRKSGGYDALVLSWVKVFTDKRKGKVIKQLSVNQ